MATNPTGTEPAVTVNFILVMGFTGAGKSHFINKLAGIEAVKEGHKLRSCTQECEAVFATIGKTGFFLIDTPGFDDTDRDSAEILHTITSFLTMQCNIGDKYAELKGIIYLHRISDDRCGKVAIDTFNICKKICGENALSNLMLVTTRWDRVDDAKGEENEKELREDFWSLMLQNGSIMSRFYGTKESGDGLVSQLLARDTVKLAVLEELVDQRLTLDQTAAGQYVGKTLEEREKEFKRELESLDALDDSVPESDRGMKRKVRKDREKASSRLKAAEVHRANLKRPVADEVDEKIREQQKKKSKFIRLLAFLPLTVSLLGAFVGIAPGSTGIFSTWLEENGMTAGSESLAGLFEM